MSQRNDTLNGGSPAEQPEHDDTVDFLEHLRLGGRRVFPRAFIKLGGTVVYDTRDLDEWLASCQRQSTSELPTPGLSPRRRGSVVTPRPAPVGGLPGEALGHLLGSTLTASDVEKTATSDDRGGRPCVQKSR